MRAAAAGPGGPSRIAKASSVTALAGRAALAIEHSRPGIGHAGDDAVKAGAEGAPREHALRGGDHEHLEHEAMIVTGLLAALPVRKDLAHGLGLEPALGGKAPGPAMREPWKGAGADIEAQQLGQQMIVR